MQYTLYTLHIIQYTLLLLYTVYAAYSIQNRLTLMYMVLLPWQQVVWYQCNTGGGCPETTPLILAVVPACTGAVLKHVLPVLTLALSSILSFFISCHTHTHKKQLITSTKDAKPLKLCISAGSWIVTRNIEERVL